MNLHIARAHYCTKLLTIRRQADGRFWWAVLVGGSASFPLAFLPVIMVSCQVKKGAKLCAEGFSQLARQLSLTIQSKNGAKILDIEKILLLLLPGALRREIREMRSELPLKKA